MPDLEKQLKEVTAKVETLTADVAKSAEVVKAKDAEIADLKKQLTSAQEGIAKAGKRKEEMEKFRGSLSGTLQKAFDNMADDEKETFMTGYKKSEGAENPVAKALESVTKANEELTKRLQKMEAASELAKAREELKGLAGVVNLEEFIPSYLELRKAAPEHAEGIVKQLKAAAAQVQKSGLFKAIGRDGGSEGENPVEKLDREVKKYQEAHPGVNAAEAEAKVLEANPTLYSEYRKFQRAAAV